MSNTKTVEQDLIGQGRAKLYPFMLYLRRKEQRQGVKYQFSPKPADILSFRQRS